MVNSRTGIQHKKYQIDKAVIDFSTQNVSLENKRLALIANQATLIAVLIATLIAPPLVLAEASPTWRREEADFSARAGAAGHFTDR